MPETPLISIVIASYTMDRFKDVTELLDSIKAQTYKHMQILLIVERSTELFDGVKRHIEEKSIPNILLTFNEKEPGFLASRNLGISQSEGEIVAFIDDDALIFPDWAEELVKTYDDPKIVGVTGPAILKWECDQIGWFPEEFYWIIGGTAWFDSDKIIEVRNVWGMNMSFLKEVLNKYQFVYGHDAAHDGAKVGLGGDDTELSIRIHRDTGGLIVFNPKVRVYHKVYTNRLTNKYIRQRIYWEGYTKAVMRKAYIREGKKSRVLTLEYALLRRILFKLMPSIALGFFRHPAIAWKQLCFTIRALYHISLGYFSGLLPILGKLTRKSYGANP